MAPLRSLGNTASIFDDFYGRTGKDAADPVPPIVYNLEDSPSITYTNNSILSGSNDKIWVWNGGKGLFVTSSDIFTETSGNSRSTTNTGNRSSSTATFTIPEGLAWVYAVVIGGGGGGSHDNPPRPGGGGGGACFAKIDLRTRFGQTMTLSSGAGGASAGSNGEDSTLSIGGVTLLTGGKGEGGGYQQGDAANYLASGGPGGTYTVSSNSDIIYSYGLDGGDGGGDLGTGQNGFAGATGGGGCAVSNDNTTANGGEGQFWWGGGGAGADVNNGAGGLHNPSFTVAYDSVRSLYPIANINKEYSLVSGITFFSDTTSDYVFDGTNGTTTSNLAPAGYFGSGGGGSSGGTGSPGGPGAVIIWWD